MNKQNLAIPNWLEEDRPREKMLSKGKNALSDAELLAILIGTGSGSRTAVDLGRELLYLCGGDLHELARLRLPQLCSVKGIGATKALKIMSALELGRRRKEQQVAKRRKMTSAFDGYNLVKQLYHDLDHEEFHIILLNRSNEVIGIRQVSVGGQSGTYVDPKIIFKVAIDLGSAAIVLTHNHPSGICVPSLNDSELTTRMVQFGRMIELPVIDHIIVTDNGYFSFSDNGILA